MHAFGPPLDGLINGCDRSYVDIPHPLTINASRHASRIEWVWRDLRIGVDAIAQLVHKLGEGFHGALGPAVLR